MTTNHSIVTKRPAGERGLADHGWLTARHTFSFAGYFDPDHMGFRSLRVMNHDTIAPSGGFPMHPHENMEIFTYVIDGALAHRDSMGNEAVIQPGHLQYMSAGSGVTHSEFNPSDEHRTQLYQIWLRPSQKNTPPRYAEKPLGEQAGPNRLTLLFSGDGRDGSTPIHQDAEISFGRLDPEQQLSLQPSTERPYLWIQLISGRLQLLDETLEEGDGLAIENPPGEIRIAASADSRFLLFELS